jgi:hypothetical protein
MKAIRSVIRADAPCTGRGGLPTGSIPGSSDRGGGFARRLTGILWAVWRDGTVYDPTRVGHASAQGVSRHAQDLSFQALSLKLAGAKAARRVRMARRALA